MQRYTLLLFAFMAISITSFAQDAIKLHPDNTHYFSFHGKPTVLIASAEHYGAVLNEQIDYVAYLDIMFKNGFNQTRAFSGAYCEGDPYDFKKSDLQADQNTLAPRPGKYITPWVLTQGPKGDQPPVYDLKKWNEKYFTRLKDYLTEAAKRNVIVEVVLFTAIYSPDFWLNCPLNPRNNGNATGTDVPYNEFHLPQHKQLREYQLAMVEKIVREVNGFDNVYFEICNEPYWVKGIPEFSTIKVQQFLPEIEEWESTIAKKITDVERSLPNKHLIAQNIANLYKKVDAVDGSVSFLNFHYAFPPTSVTDNYSLSKPIVFDETALGCNAPDRRRESWAFMLNGGAGYSNLDWSYANDDITGLGRNPHGKRESGKEVREQLATLVKTMNSFDFVHSSPVSAKIKKAQDVQQYGLGVTGKDYIIYCLKDKEVDHEKLEISDIPAKKYSIEFIDPVDGSVKKTESYNHKGGSLSVPLPAFPDDLLVRIRE